MKAINALGLNGIFIPPAYGGAGLSYFDVVLVIEEMAKACGVTARIVVEGNMGALGIILRYGSEALQRRYAPWVLQGDKPAIAISEPQAGSDLAQVRTKAVPDGDHYRVSGQKIFITYGEHDLARNIIHMVLARIEGAPAGIKGISLFIIPKFLPGGDGTLGERNDLRCVSIEHKLGIHASPTAVMSYGDGGGALGYLVGEENRGIECMFTMMNAARLGVGLEGVAIAERAYQQARAFALERIQGRALGGDADSVAIVHHPDVRRMLLSMRAQTEAARALAYFVAACLDMAKRHQNEKVRRQRQTLVDLLTPVVKAWSTDTGIEVANTGIQVHGGMGYVEETGAAQHLRDARIAAIYEGTNGIQANDLVGRKVARDNGDGANAFIAMVRELDRELAAAQGDDIAAIRARLAGGADALAGATRWLVETYPSDPRSVAAGAVHYLRLLGIVAGGWMMARAALIAAASPAAGGGDPGFLRAKLVSARFFADQVLVQAGTLATVFTQGAAFVRHEGPEGT